MQFLFILNFNSGSSHTYSAEKMLKAIPSFSFEYNGKMPNIQSDKEIKILRIIVVRPVKYPVTNLFATRLRLLPSAAKFIVISRQL